MSTEEGQKEEKDWHVKPAERKGEVDLPVIPEGNNSKRVDVAGIF